MDPPVMGYNSVNIKINLISPCKMLPTDGLTHAMALKLRQKCEDQYEHLFLNELELMCPQKSPSLMKHKRELFTAIALLVIFVIGSAGIGIASYAVHETDGIKVTQAEIERTLDDLEEKATINSKNLFFLKEEVQKMGQTVNKLIMDINLFKEKVIEVQYLVSYLVSRLLIGRGVILHTKKLWKQKSMDGAFFEFLNFTLPCGEECPIDLGEPKKCSVDLDEHTLDMEFAVPVTNPNLTIVKADPFFLMLKEDNQTCKITYHGPENALISPEEDCVHAVDMGKETRGRIFFPHSQKCQPQISNKNEKQWFGLQNCYPSKEGDEVDYIQVKAYQNRLHIYCPGVEYTLGQTRVVKCPNKVFTLPLTATFTLNNMTYQGRTMNLVYNEKEDPLFKEKLEWHLTPIINWDSLNQTFPIFKPLDHDHWKKADSQFWTIICVGSAGFGIIGLILIWKKMRGLCQRRNPPRRKGRRTSKGDKPQGMELEPISNTTEPDQSSDEESVRG
jgi:hypothetical protein